MCHRPSPLLTVLAAAVGASALLSLSCGGDSPSSSTPNTTLAPTPSPSSGPISSSTCHLGKGDPYADCDRDATLLLPQLDAAQDRLVETHPELFNPQDEAGAGTRAYRVLDKEAYMNGLVATLQAAGLCAQRDQDDAAQQSVFVKNSNDFSETFDVLLSSGHMRRGQGAYRQSCWPASFPFDRPAEWPPVSAGCYKPFPPDLFAMACKVHTGAAGHVDLDSTPIVADPVYCAAIGFTDGRAQCAIRVEGSIDRLACENWRVGNAEDTRKPGPTWTNEEGKFCTGPESGCQHSPDNPYQIWAFRPGTFTVAAQSGRPCTVTVE